MLTTRRQLCALGLYLLTPLSLMAGKVPLHPEELQSEARLIVIGQVQSHSDHDRTHEDGSQSKIVRVTVKLESIEKGVDVQVGQTLDALFWVVVKAPRRGILWDSGHWGIPADGGRVRLFLTPREDQAWDVIYPNGFERLDETPPLHYAFAPADSVDPWFWVGFACGLLAVPIAAVTTLVILRRRGKTIAAKTPNDEPSPT